MRDRLIWFKGEVVPVSEAKVHALSPTAQFGLNVFEGLRAYWNQEDDQLYLFRLVEHLNRLEQSARLIGFGTGVERDLIVDAIRQVIDANGYREDVAVRVILFLDEEGTWSSDGAVQLMVAPIPKPRSGSQAAEGLKACVTTWRRINEMSLPPRIKCGANYINSRHGFMEARRNGYDAPIFLDEAGKVTEGAGACILLVRDGRLITPPPTSSVLESITRHTILDLATRIGIDTEVRVVDRTELYLADELFLCGTSVELMPIVNIDGFVVGTGDAGPLTMTLLGDYLAAASTLTEGSREWLTPVYT